MRKLLLLFLCAAPALAQVQYGRLSGFCEAGNQTINVIGYASSTATPVQRSYPGCTVRVYNTGTLTLATIYSTSFGTALANPFTAATSGYWFFYAANGGYDVQLSGTQPSVTYGGQYVFTATDYTPHVVEAYALGGASGVIESQAGGSTVFAAGFQAPTFISANLIWTLPTTDAIGCVQSNGAFALSISGCPAGGSPTDVQYNFGGVLAGSSNFTWSNPALTVNGLVKSAYVVQANAANSAGGYIDFPPVTTGTAPCLDSFGNQVYIPSPVGGGSFPNNDVILWNSTSPYPGVAPPGCATAIPPTNIDYGLNTNGYILSAVGFATSGTAFNSIYSFTGGMVAASITAGGYYPPGTVTACCGTVGALGAYIGGYMAMGHSVGPPAAGTVATVNNPLTDGDGIEQGTFYWDDALATARVCSAASGGTCTSWTNLGGGGGGSTVPGGAVYNVQINNPAGTFYGDGNFQYHPGTTGIVSLNGVFYANTTNGGFDASGTAFNAVQAPAGGVYALSAAFGGAGGVGGYVNVGNYATTLATGPPLRSGDGFNPGAISYYTGSGGGGPCLAVYTNASTFSCITASAGAGGSNTQVQYNSSGTLAGSGNLTWNNGSQLLSITAASSSVAGLNVATGLVRADQGFLANGSTCFNYNCFQAPSGGMGNTLSFTAINYVQIGTYNASGSATAPPLTSADSFQKGAMSWDITAACVKVYNGTSWGCLGGGGSSYWTLTASNLYPNLTTYKLLVGETTNVTGSDLEVNGNITSLDIVEGYTAGTSYGNIAFQTAAAGTGGCVPASVNCFQVDFYGDISAGGSVNAYGNTPLNLAPYRLAGATIVDFNRNAFFASCTGCGPTTQQDRHLTRSLGTIYQNVFSFGLYVNVGVAIGSSGTGAIAVCDSSSSPSTTVAIGGGVPFAQSTLGFWVPPGFYYEVYLFNPSGGSEISWIENH